MKKRVIRYNLNLTKSIKLIDTHINDVVREFISNLPANLYVLEDQDAMELLFYKDFLGTLSDKLQDVKAEYETMTSEFYALVGNSRLDCVVEEVYSFLVEVIGEWLRR